MTDDHEATIERRTIYEGRILTLRVETVRLRNGRTAQREIVEHGGAVCVVALDEQGRVLLVRQYRKAAGTSLLEVPAGGLDPGERPEAAAHRELREETGYAAARMEPLASFWLAPGYSTEVMHAFLATGLTSGAAAQEEDEDITTEWAPLEQTPQLVARGEVRDAKSIAALLLALHRLRAGEG